MKFSTALAFLLTTAMAVHAMPVDRRNAPGQPSAQGQPPAPAPAPAPGQPPQGQPPKGQPPQGQPPKVGQPPNSPANSPSNPNANNKQFNPQSNNGGTTGSYALSGAAAHVNPAAQDPNFKKESNNYGHAGKDAQAGALADAIHKQDAYNNGKPNPNPKTDNEYKAGNNGNQKLQQYSQQVKPQGASNGNAGKLSTAIDNYAKTGNTKKGGQ